MGRVKTEMDIENNIYLFLFHTSYSKFMQIFCFFTVFVYVSTRLYIYHPSKDDQLLTKKRTLKKGDSCCTPFTYSASNIYFGILWCTGV